MLRKETVSPQLLKSLKALMEMDSLKNHRLVGGTALALQIGHRISVDIDLFSDKKNDYNKILVELKQKFGKKFVESRTINGMMGKGISIFTNDIKTDIVDWNTKFIKPQIVDEGIRMASKEDIIPMKFNTFMCAPEFARYEKKDYTDIAMLLKEYSLADMMKLYKSKYPGQLMSDRMMIEGLELNEMADKRPMPQMLNGVTWLDVKKRLESAILSFSKNRIVKKKHRK